MKSYLLILFGAFLLLACQNDQSKKQHEGELTAEEEFLSFRKKFLRDSLFQMDHITFPLDGRPDKASAGDTLPNGQFMWQEDKWLMHKEIDPARSGFVVKYSWLTDNLVEETLINEQVGLGMMRRFAKRPGEDWELIYYIGLSSVRQ